MKYFEVLGIKPKFLLEKDDIKKMEETFLFLQKQQHNEGVVDLQSRIINEAYTAIKDDAKRIIYIWKALNIDPLQIKMKQELVESVIELREDLEDSETEEELKTKLEDAIIEFEEVKQNLNEEVEKILTENSHKPETLIDLFCHFKTLSEVIKKYKNHSL